MAQWKGGVEGAVVDRTSEFFGAVSAQVQAGVRPLAGLSGSSAPPGGPSAGGGHGGRLTPTEEARAFGRRAAELSGKISLTSKKLQHLAQLTRRQGTFDDPMDEINVLSARLKEDTKLIKYELDQLQAFLDGNRQQVGGGSGNAVEHSSAIVQTMKMQLSSTAADFKNVLEQRQANMRKKADRRGLFGTKRAPLAAPTVPKAGLQHRGSQAARNNIGGGSGAGAHGPNSPSSGGNVGANGAGYSSSGKTESGSPAPMDGAAALPRPQGVSVVEQRPSPYSPTPFGERSPGTQGNDDEEVGFDEAPLIQQTATVQDNAYLSSRVQAMNSIETHISELGEVFHQLAHMVADSRISIERIDDNVAAAQENIQQGYEQLVRTWMGVSNNRWLAAKILFVIMFFMTFFVVFLA
mmetsp:Transcript_12386/g.24085  ORF Transcript_12386/g.24085 Transcript_12386/m.24085 type:complete len:408 (-) Transcript_12386:215-1438(-)|eukprot:CAMPEP_0171493182 /NCGR_PEP_ID=MMETSP0958-20121227/4826_1 /TAXON_ID=87120 /ORGANISM="Aurantiochytrium limacinum, Strain ATCCMYA-1381" /LENGTH=407 /DNA_ID=CAMNT_0012026789 /DNA_START=282 /DNA_END=1505 /DNA_ORIENTATION=+